jgi:hypothetical protein
VARVDLVEVEGHEEQQRDEPRCDEPPERAAELVVEALGRTS